MQQKFIAKCVRFFITKLTLLLQNGTVNYKVRRLLQIATVQYIWLADFYSLIVTSHLSWVTVISPPRRIFNFQNRREVLKYVNFFINLLTYWHLDYKIFYAICIYNIYTLFTGGCLINVWYCISFLLNIKSELVIYRAFLHRWLIYWRSAFINLQLFKNWFIF